MGLSKRVCAVALLATVPVAAQDIDGALLALCEGATAYDPADVEAVRGNADDFCAVLLSEPSKARRQLGKMLVRNRAALNANRWYIDARRVPSRHRHRYEGAYLQLRRPWMGADWGIDWEPCYGLLRPRYDKHHTFHHNYRCFGYTRYDHAGNVLRSFHLSIRWGRWEDTADGWYLSAETRHTDAVREVDAARCRVVVHLFDPEHGLNRIGDMLDGEQDGGCE